MVEDASPLRQARRSAGLSAERLGALAGVSWRTVLRLERGVNKPKPETRGRLAAALGVSPTDLWPVNERGRGRHSLVLEKEVGDRVSPRVPPEA